MSPRGDHGVCETCHRPGVLALFRAPTASPTASLHGPMTTTFAVALCVGCAERARLPRWFDAAPMAVAVVA